MGAIGYLYVRTLKNRIRTAVHKPITYFYLVIILFYMLALPFSLRIWTGEFGIDTPEGLTGVLTVIAFWLIPGNLIAFAKRKGLAYRNSDIHFLFPAPVSPKRVLVYAYLRMLPSQLLLNLFAVFCGLFTFSVPGWKMLLYFLFSVLLENVLEGGIMLLLYGTERLEERQRGWFIRGAYSLVGVLVVIALVFYLREGLSFETVKHFLHSDAVQMVPVIGWYISVLHLLFTGATTVNLVGSVLYLCLALAVLTAAGRMKCTGAFYEDAMKFAEDYEEVLASRRQGNTERRLGRKQKLGKASVSWKGTGARAIFDRQLLEYKKRRFFLFDSTTVIALAAGLGIAWIALREGFGEFAPFIIPAASAYLIFIFTAMNGKWAKELKSPYTYLIPDTSFAKLVNATAIQHIQSLINALLITIPGAIVMRLSPALILLGIAGYVILSANKLYALAVAEIVAGNTFGAVGKQMLQMLMQGFAILVAGLGAGLGNMLGGVTIAFLLMDVFLLLFTTAFMALASLNFEKLEN
ncbi:MAG: putative ABC exporter domain-containing protein [Roseburia sp.]|nr:putative ABC exporter domain-containing protein [Roseburia sp.]MCM1097201.1 putative ABC exporter domain-containing protein [Ruminococcus flavefaciens]